MTETIVTIPLAKLRRSKDNVRKTERGTEIAALAASIEAHGLLQNLTVTPVRSNGPEECYEVIAGGRRLEALKLLAKRKRIADNFGVPCRLLARESVGSVEVSLAENVMRLPLHPADQFEAFSRLHAEGLGAAAIAARFGVTQKMVEQRLKLAAVSPKLLAAYRDGQMTLEQLSAFTITDDHAPQERIWFEAPLFDRSAQAIRRALTKALVAGTDRRTRFIGIDAYEAAGGTVIRDLFDEDATYFTDVGLLERMVTEKLQVEAERVRIEGWSWVELRPELDYEQLARFGRVPPMKSALSAKEERKLTRLCERHDEIVAELEDEPNQSALAELDRLSHKIEDLSQKREQWSKKAKARSGAIVSLDPDGRLRVVYGLVCGAVDEAASRKRAPEDPAPETVEPADSLGDDGTNGSGLSDALLRDLSAHHTAALREELAAHPEVALTALLHTLALRTFHEATYQACLDIRPVLIDLAPLADGIGESPAVIAMAERHRRWAEAMPEPDGLWTWLASQPLESRLELLSYVVARSVNSVRQRYDAGSAERFAQAEHMARAVSLDMAKWWHPTRNTYFDRVSKRKITGAISEALSPRTAQAIAALKKPAMALKAEELLKGLTWLPAPLRLGSPQ